MNTVETLVESPLNYTEEDASWTAANLAKEGWILPPPTQQWSAKMRCIKISQNGELIAVAWVDQAENSWLAKTADILTQNRLEQAMLLWSVWVSPTAKAWTPAIFYLALRRGRIWEKKQVLVGSEKSQFTPLSLLRLIPVEDLVINSENKIITFQAQQIPYGLHLCYQHCQGEANALVQGEFCNEIIETVSVFLEKFFRNKWCEAIHNRTMTKQQYIQCLYNTHSYVRYTTRLIGRCIGFTDNEDLRNHYIYHLKGEINHEKIIERDLAYLGADVEYLLKYYVPNLATKEFMITQESTIAFAQNTILMLACPLAAEGITAAFTPPFLEALCATIGSWGVANPKEAARFLISHANTDGGDDGHWENVKKMTKRFITSEHLLQQFLGVYAIATEGLQRSFVSSIEENNLWSRTSA